MGAAHEAHEGRAQGRGHVLELEAVAFDVTVQGGFEAGGVEGIAGGEELGHGIEALLASVRFLAQAFSS